jgi:hypothetical protein
MTYLILRYVHLLGLTLMGAGLIGVWYTDLRSRQVRDLVVFADAVRQIAVFYDGLMVPGALLWLGSGTWLSATGTPRHDGKNGLLAGHQTAVLRNTRAHCSWNPVAMSRSW